MKVEYIVVYENTLDKFDNGHQGQGHRWTFPPFTKIQTIRSYNSTLVQARKLKLSLYVHLIIQSHQDSAIAEILAECFPPPDNVILERILLHTLLRPGHSLS